MEGKFGNNDHEDDSANSPISEPDEAAYLPSPKKSRRNTRKKVVTVPIIEGGDGSRSRGEVYPPSDSWSWRKYGQKPIKGSPYPRGYYRCSSSKGCPAKKQVERSRLDPTTLLITYASEHNHTLSSAIKNTVVSVGSTSHNSSSTTTTEETPDPPANFPPEECAAFANQPDIEPSDSNGFAEMAGEFGWLCHVGSTMMDGAATLVGPAWAHNAEVEMLMPIGEEDKLLFGDLGDLPESANVFRQKSIKLETPCGEAR